MTSRQPTRRLARLLTALLAVVLVPAFPGCTTLGGMFGRGDDPFGPKAACRLPPNPALPELVDHLNQNIARLPAWRSTDAVIYARGPNGIPVRLTAFIAVEEPRRFRLLADSIGGPEVDLGSNLDEFWLWMKQNDPYNVYFARHDELSAAQRRLRIPFEPDWLLEALGVSPIDPAELTLVPGSGPIATLVADRISPQGEPVRKTMVVDTCHGLVLEQNLYNSAGVLLAQAKFERYRIEPMTGAVLPRTIALNWPQARLSLTMHLGQVDVAPGALPDATWTKPNLPAIDLGQ